MCARMAELEREACVKIAATAVVCVLGIGGAGGAEADDALRRQAAALFGQVKADVNPFTPQAELGRALFWDTRVSADGKTACASCHEARDWGADRRKFS